MPIDRSFVKICSQLSDEEKRLTLEAINTHNRVGLSNLHLGKLPFVDLLVVLDSLAQKINHFNTTPLAPRIRLLNKILKNILGKAFKKFKEVDASDAKFHNVMLYYHKPIYLEIYTRNLKSYNKWIAEEMAKQLDWVYLIGEPSPWWGWKKEIDKVKNFKPKYRIDTAPKTTPRRRK